MADPRLRQLLLAVQVVYDIDLELAGDGLRLPTGGGWVEVSEDLLLDVVRGVGPSADRVRPKLARWLRRLRELAGWSAARTAAAARPVGLPRGHALHPGPGFPLRQVIGDCLDLGIGLLGLDPDTPDAVVAVDPSLWRACALTPGHYWPTAQTLLERMGELAARRWQLDPGGLLRPMGDCDVVTLLGSGSLRRALAEATGGLCPAVVPMRTRGWTRLSRLDPAFAPAAAAATEPEQRGFTRPVLVTVSEVTLAKPGGQPVTLVLSDPAPSERAGQR